MPPSRPLPVGVLSQAVRVGDVVAFKGVLAAHEATFRADLTLPLIARLHQNVIKTGLRKISLTCVLAPCAPSAQFWGAPPVC